MEETIRWRAYTLHCADPSVERPQWVWEPGDDDVELIDEIVLIHSSDHWSASIGLAYDGMTVGSWSADAATPDGALDGASKAFFDEMAVFLGRCREALGGGGDCYFCHGSGSVVRRVNDGDEHFDEMSESCTECGGTGRRA